jgi:hypothetical protein
MYVRQIGYTAGFNLGVNENRATSYCTLLGFELEKMLSDNQQLLYD